MVHMVSCTKKNHNLVIEIIVFIKMAAPLSLLSVNDFCNVTAKASLNNPI